MEATENYYRRMALKEVAITQQHEWYSHTFEAVQAEAAQVVANVLPFNRENKA